MMDKLQTIPPQNVDAEKSVLGAILLNPEVVPDVMEVLSVGPDAFYREQHRAIYRAVVALRAKREPVDVMTLIDEMGGNLDAAGGISYIAGLSGFVPTSANAEHYAAIVRDKYMLRCLIAECSRISQRAFTEGMAGDLIQDAVSAIGGISCSSARQGFKTLMDGMEEAVGNLSNLLRTGTAGGVATGFKNIDELLCGIDKHTLTVLAARPGVGKTALALSMAINIAERGEEVLLFSMEMSCAQIAERAIYSLGRLEKRALIGKYISEADMMQRVNYAVSSPVIDRIHIDDNSRHTALSLSSRIKRFLSKRKVSVIIIDYLQLITPPKGSRQSKYEQTSEISRELKILSGEIDVPIIALAQLNREASDGEPQLHQLRDSGSIEQDANNVMLLWPIKGDTIGCKIAKQRNGPTGTVCIHFDKDTQTYRDSADRYCAQNGKKHLVTVGAVENTYEEDENDVF